jgi:hypothetical protein
MSAIFDAGEKPQLIKILFVLHPGFDTVSVMWKHYYPKLADT